MPTLFRFLIWCAIIAGTIYTIMWALAYGVDPIPREAYVKIPSERVNPPQPDIGQ
jgi:predicted secreted protein